jgi:hypothetical protein
LIVSTTRAGGLGRGTDQIEVLRVLAVDHVDDPLIGRCGLRERCQTRGGTREGERSELFWRPR